MEWMKSVLAWLLQHGEFVADVLSFICFLGVFYLLDQIVPEITFKQKLAIFALIIGYGFWDTARYSFRQGFKQGLKKETQNASVLSFTLTAKDPNTVQVKSELRLEPNIPDWGNRLLEEEQDLLEDKYRALARKETDL